MTIHDDSDHRPIDDTQIRDYDGEVWISARLAASILAVNVVTLRAWAIGISRGNGFYKLSDIIEQYVQRAKRPTKNVTSAKLRKEIAQAEKTELELEKIKGNLVEVEAVEANLYEAITQAKSRLLAIPNRLAPRLVDEPDANKIQTVLKDGISDALTDISAWRYAPEDDAASEGDVNEVLGGF